MPDIPPERLSILGTGDPDYSPAFAKKNDAKMLLAFRLTLLAGFVALLAFGFLGLLIAVVHIPTCGS